MCESSDNPHNGFERMTFDVPKSLANELRYFLENVEAIKRAGYIGLNVAERRLERLAGEFYKYRDSRYTVQDFGSNVTEAYSIAQNMIVAGTTPAYFDAWRENDGGGSRSLLHANEEFVRQKSGRVIRFFFVPDHDFERRYPELGNILRGHISKGVEAIVIAVNTYGDDVLTHVFPGGVNLDRLEIAFVDSRIFLRTIFGNEINIEVAQDANACRIEYKTSLRPFLASRPHYLLRPRLHANADEVVYGDPLTDSEVKELKGDIEAVIIGSRSTLVPT